MVEPDWVGQLNGFTLLFEVLVLMLVQQMPFAAVARAVNLSWHRVHAIRSRYVELALAAADLSGVPAVAIDETSYLRVHEYLTLVADVPARRVVVVTTRKDASTIEHLRPIRANTVARPGKSARSALRCRRLSSKASMNICPTRE
ncbi:helix-turn-helix domain-containing protein [Paraburkholderia dipogonis]|uniref:helix-turn-helix domain-containing protein n=1 Tax=Paraburkholderia dipogonis TaxID=1211383 RepID=UPI001FCA8C73|nr:helix-turn-helix domain-containing protein [Paraburkholderia dipogonis]